MGKDVDSYRREYRQMVDNIIDQRKENKRIQKEIELLEKAKSKLESLRDHEAKEIEDAATSKKCGSNLRWRGKRKKEYDEFFDQEVKPKAKAFKKAINGIAKEVSNALKRKRKELGDGEKAIIKYRKAKERAEKQIDKLLRKEQGGGGFR